MDPLSIGWVPAIELKSVTLREALDNILVPLGYSYIFEGKSVRVLAKTTKIFHVDVPFATRGFSSDVTASIGGGSTGGGVGGGGGGGTSGGQGTGGSTSTANMKVTNKATLDFWQNLDKTIKSIIGKDKSTIYTIEPISGTIVVSGKPETVKKVENFIKNYPDFKIVGLRYFNVYGKNEFFKDKTASMVLQFGLGILGGNTPRLFEGSDKILRDFIYIEDVIQANIKAMNPKKSGVYNVGTSKARSFQDIADILQNVFGTDLGNTYIPNPYIGQYQFFTQADIETTKEFLDYLPNHSLEEGIKAYANEIKNIFDKEL
jgi:hypothetical protein